MKKIIIAFGIAMLMLASAVFGATPSCGDYINSDITFDSDLNCTTAYSGSASTLHINSSNIVIDCAGYSIYQNTQYTPIFKATMDLNNVTVKNCNFYSDVVFYDYTGYSFVEFNWIDNYWEYIGTSDWIDFVDFNGGMWWNDSVVSGNTMVVNSTATQGIYIMYIYDTSNLEISNNKITTNLNDPLFWIACDFEQDTTIKNNDITNTGDDMIFRIYNSCATTGDLEIYDNNLSWSTNTKVSDIYNVTDYWYWGNYYGSCTDNDVDGICDSLFNSQNWWDYGALSNPAPCLTCEIPSPPPVEETWSPTYEPNDIVPALFDGIGRMLLTFVAFAGIIVMILLGSWGFRKIKGKR